MPPDRKTPAGSALRPVLRVERGVATSDDDHLAEEVPVAMHFDGEPFAVMMATPADLEDFARGFALTEGKVDSIADIERIEVREVLEGITIDVRRVWSAAEAVAGILGTGAPRHAAGPRRELPGRSGCGICGSRELEDVVRRPEPVGVGPTIGTDAIERALESLRASQPINTVSGAVHAAGWALQDGTLVCVREDVGRHNALDKLIGAMGTSRLPTDEGFVVITSRASYEMVTKAAVAGMTIVVATSAPTALAVHLASDCGVTLIGFARPGRFNIYSRPQRVI